MVASKIEPKEEPVVVVPNKESKVKQTTPVKVAQHEQEDVQMKSAENKNTVKSDVEEEEDMVPKKKGRLIKNSTAKKQFSEDEEEFKPMIKKRVQIDSDSEMMADGDQENKNIPNVQ